MYSDIIIFCCTLISKHANTFKKSITTLLILQKKPCHYYHDYCIKAVLHTKDHFPDMATNSWQNRVVLFEGGWADYIHIYICVKFIAV